MLSSCTFNLTSTFEILEIDGNLKSSHRTGFYDISKNLLKRIIDVIFETLCAIFNLPLNIGVFPEQMKIAKVCPIFKSGNKTQSNNYRAISLIPVFSKILEKIVSNRLLSYIEKYKIFFSAKFGFRKKHSSSVALMKLYDMVHRLWIIENFALAYSSTCPKPLTHLIVVYFYKSYRDMAFEASPTI